MKNITQQEELFFPSHKLPEKNVPVFVLCEQFRCLGYLDEEGIWRSYYSNRILENVVGWLSNN